MSEKTSFLFVFAAIATILGFLVLVYPEIIPLMRGVADKLVNTSASVPERHAALPPSRESPRPAGPAALPMLENKPADIKALINKLSLPRGEKPNVAIVIRSITPNAPGSNASGFYGSIKTDRMNIVLNLFKEEAFKRSEFFTQIYNGDTDSLRKSGALEGVNYLILGELDYEFREVPYGKNVITCALGITYKIFDTEGRMVKTDRIAGFTCPADFSRDAALAKGLEALAQEFTKRMIPVVTS